MRFHDQLVRAGGNVRISGSRCWSALLVVVLVMLAAPAGQARAPGPRIHDIQGTKRVSPLVGQRVVGVPGIVTAVRASEARNGFWFQDRYPDDDPRTSEALFVSTGDHAPNATAGDEVLVDGTVSEHRPGSPGESFQPVTELVDATWSTRSRGNELPAAELLTPEQVPERYAPTPGSDIESLPLQPERYALDFYASRAGMRVRVDDARVVGPTSGHDELYITSKPDQRPTPRGGTVYSGYSEQNSGRLKVESLLPVDQLAIPKADVGDELSGSTVGPLDYDAYGGYTIRTTSMGTLVPGGLAPQTTRPQRSGELAVATYNVENLSQLDERATFDRLGRHVAANLAGPDILALQEIQDDSGPADDGVVAANETLRRLRDAIAAAGGPRYEWRQIDPEDNVDGGQPGANIRVAFLFDPTRVSFVDRPGGEARTPVRVRAEGGRPALSVSPGRVDPVHSAWEETRKPLAGEFAFGNRTVFVVANHFASKGEDHPLHSGIQPPPRPSEQQRVKQAASVRSFVDDIRAVDPKANVVVTGDLNDFQFSPTLRELRSTGLRTLVSTLPVEERYGYVYEGNSQMLDHVLTSPAPRGVEYEVVHLNAEFADQVSDHDPHVVRLRPSATNAAANRWYDWLDWVERITGHATLQR